MELDGDGELDGLRPRQRRSGGDWVRPLWGGEGDCLEAGDWGRCLGCAGGTRRDGEGGRLRGGGDSCLLGENGPRLPRGVNDLLQTWGGVSRLRWSLRPGCPCNITTGLLPRTLVCPSWRLDGWLECPVTGWLKIALTLVAAP